MARARNIKPGFFINDELAEIEPLGRILFAGLWTIADREGRLEDRPKKIKAEVVPYDNCNVDKLLQALHDKDFIQRYEVNGNKYIAILNFKKHQNPHKNEAPSVIPAPSETARCKHGASTVQVPEMHTTNPADSLLLIPDSLNPITAPPNFDAEFEIWWEDYPRKKGKTDAQKYWRKLRGKGVSVELLITARNNYAAEMKGKSMDYVMHGSTFLGPGERWKDYQEPKQQEELSVSNKMEISPEQHEIYSKPYIRRVDDG